MKKNFKLTLLWCMAIIAAALCLSSCVTERKARNWYMDHKDKAAEFCSDIFPPVIEREVVERDTVFADNIDYSSAIDSLQDQLAYARGILDMYAKNAPDTCKYLVDAYEKQINLMAAEIKKLRDIYKPCKPNIITIRKTVSIVDGALKDVNARLEEQLKQEQSKSKNRLYWIIGLAVLLAGSGYLNVRKVFF